MSNLHQIIYKTATDADFRTAFLKDPKTALGQLELQISEPEMQVLISMKHLLVLPSWDLLALIRSSSNEPNPWPDALARSSLGDECAETM